MNLTIEELKFIGFSGIISQSFKTIFTWKKIFAQITLTFILPLAFILIAHMEISNRFFYQIERNPYQLLISFFDSYQSYYTTIATASDWRNYLIFKSLTVATVTAVVVPSTATVVFTVASVYTGRDITFRKSIKIVPKVYKRLTVTFLCMLLTLLSYSLITSVVFFIFNAVLQLSPIRILILLAIIILYIYGFLHITITWQIAIVVSVLEPSYGIKSMIKSTDLMNGETKTALTISFISYQFLTAVLCVYTSLILYDTAALVAVWRWMIGFVCFVAVVMVLLVMMVSQTVVYLVCKSYHREAVDTVSLSTYLSAYLSDSRAVVRVGEDIQLGRPQSLPVPQV